MRTREENIAWAAGLFDGEGSIMSKPYAGGRIQLMCDNTDFDVMQRFIATVLVGNLYYRKKLTIGGKRAISWQATSKHDVDYVIGLFWKFLSERRRNKFMELDTVRSVRPQRCSSRFSRIAA